MYSNHVLIAIVIYRYDIIAINRTEVVYVLIELYSSGHRCVRGTQRVERNSISVVTMMRGENNNVFISCRQIISDFRLSVTVTERLNFKACIKIWSSVLLNGKLSFCLLFALIYVNTSGVYWERYVN